MSLTPPVIAIVVPCFNEEQALPVTARTLLEVIDRMATAGIASAESYIICVDDGSRDLTWQTIAQLHAADPRVRGIALAHNRGHQYALLAGLMEAEGRCDAAVSIDADLQDDPEAIPEMVKQFNAGAEIVYGVRASRETDTWFKRTTARGFYWFQKAMGLDTVYDHADYRLMSDRALRLLADYGESNLFIRGIVPQLGLTTAVVTYDRHRRIAGESKYPLGKMISFSVDGITSFSARPLKMIFFVGMGLLLADIGMALYVLGSYLSGHTVAGWTSLMLSVWFLGSLILIALGIVGVYVGKIFTEVKHRPRYAVRERIM